MSGQADGGGADSGGGKTRDDPWMTTVTSVSGFLAGFSLASVVVIADAPEHFRWSGWPTLGFAPTTQRCTRVTSFSSHIWA